MKRIAKILALCMAIFVGCSFVLPAQTGTLESHATSKIKISKTKATIVKGKTLQLKVKNTKKKVKWSSSNKKIATVSKKGKVTAKKSGKATITAKVGKKKLKCKITVKNPPNYKKLIVGVWAGHMQGDDYLEWEFTDNGKFYYTYYYDVFKGDPTIISGKYTISGNKLRISSGNLKTTYTIKELKKNKSLVFKNSQVTFKLYPAHT